MFGVSMEQINLQSKLETEKMGGCFLREIG